MSQGSAAEAQVVSGDKTTGIPVDESPKKEELEIAWHIASRKTTTGGEMWIGKISFSLFILIWSLSFIWLFDRV